MAVIFFNFFTLDNIVFCLLFFVHSLSFKSPKGDLVILKIFFETQIRLKVDSNRQQMADRKGVWISDDCRHGKYTRTMTPSKKNIEKTVKAVCLEDKRSMSTQLDGIEKDSFAMESYIRRG